MSANSYDIEHEDAYVAAEQQFLGDYNWHWVQQVAEFVITSDPQSLPLLWIHGWRELRVCRMISGRYRYRFYVLVDNQLHRFTLLDITRSTETI